MSRTVMPHVENESSRHSAQPQETQPPGQPNPDKATNSGYPAGGDLRPENKDEYGRGPEARRQAGLPPLEGDRDEQPGAATEGPDGAR